MQESMHRSFSRNQLESHIELSTYQCDQEIVSNRAYHKSVPLFNSFRPKHVIAGLLCLTGYRISNEMYKQRILPSRTFSGIFQRREWGILYPREVKNPPSHIRELFEWKIIQNFRKLPPHYIVCRCRTFVVRRYMTNFRSALGPDFGNENGNTSMRKFRSSSTRAGVIRQ